MAREITIDIGADGRVQVEGHGFVGDECKQLTKDLEEELGVVEQVVEKPEMHATRSRARTAVR